LKRGRNPDKNKILPQFFQKKYMGFSETGILQKISEQNNRDLQKISELLKMKNSEFI